MQTSQIPYGEDSCLCQRPRKVRPRQAKHTGDLQQMQEQSCTKKAPSFTPRRVCSESTAPLSLVNRNKQQPLAFGQTSCAQVAMFFATLKSASFCSSVSSQVLSTDGYFPFRGLWADNYWLDGAINQPSLHEWIQCPIKLRLCLRRPCNLPLAVVDQIAFYGFVCLCPNMKIWFFYNMVIYSSFPFLGY